MLFRNSRVNLQHYRVFEPKYYSLHSYKHESLISYSNGAVFKLASYKKITKLMFSFVNGGIRWEIKSICTVERFSAGGLNTH